MGRPAGWMMTVTGRPAMRSPGCPPIRDRVTVDSVRNHAARHFPVQQAARATYREILERRARENQIDFVNGVATALTPVAFYETVLVRGYETLVDPDTKVDVKTGMIAGWPAAVPPGQVRRGARRCPDDGRGQHDHQGGEVHGAAADVERNRREAAVAGTAFKGARRRDGSPRRSR
jgi:hypothetical protein